MTEWNQYVAKRTRYGTKPMPEKGRNKPSIIVDRMSSKDWLIIAEYLGILKP